MRCPVCQKGTMEKKKDIMEQDGIEFEAYKCLKCGEEIMTMKQLKIKKDLKLFQHNNILFLIK